MKIIFNTYDPKKSIYYNAGLTLKLLNKLKSNSLLLSDFLLKLEKHLKIEINLIILSIDWLLLNKGIFLFEKDGERYVSK